MGNCCDTDHATYEPYETAKQASTFTSMELEQTV